MTGPHPAPASPMPSARETLSAAHARMTPDEIAAHALLLAQFAEAQVGFTKSLLGLVGNQAKRIEILEAYNSTLMISVRRVQSLMTRKQKGAAARLLAVIASNEVQRPLGSFVDIPTLADANAIPSSLFDPQTDEPKAG